LFLLHGQVHAATAVISATGSVQDSNGNPVNDAIIEMVGNPYVTTTSDANGDFTLNGLPIGSTFAIEIVASGYMDLYSRNFNTTSNLEGLGYTLHTPFQISGWGVDSDESDIVGHVTDSSNNNLEGAVVSCTSKLHDPCTYTIEYGSPPNSVNTTATTSNGSFYVLNVDAGDTVTIHAAPTADWVFTPITFVTYADSESEGKITGSAATVPGAPTIGTATPGNAQATVTFTPPAANGSSAITGYTVTSSPGGKKASGPATAGSITVKGLTNGKTYTFTAAAANTVGPGPPSGPSNTVTPGKVPGAPTILNEKPGNGQVTVSFKLSTGTLPIKYSVAPTPPDHPSVTGSGSPVTVTGLNNGAEYTFTVTGTNATGTGPPSGPFKSATPATKPGVPSIVKVTAASGQATVFFTAPADGGSPITGYTATSSGGQKASGPATAGSITVKGLKNGKPYTFTVTATNVMGISNPSSAFGPVTIP
jgi:hypothetical protein